MLTDMIDKLIKELSAIRYNPFNYDVSAENLHAFGKRIEAFAKQINFTSDKINQLLKVKNPSGSFKEDKWKSTKQRFLGALKIMRDNAQIIESQKSIKEPALISKLEPINSNHPSNNRIFIVHGHNDEMKLSIARSIEKLCLVPIILHEQPNAGRTIIEKFRDYSDVGFAIVLLSPDDFGYKKGDKSTNARPRARQNVIFELGFFLGKLGRERVIALYMPHNDFEMPSDYSGVLYLPFDTAGRWQFDLVKELKACGFIIDANKLLD